MKISIWKFRLDWFAFFYQPGRPRSELFRQRGVCTGSPTITESSGSTATCWSEKTGKRRWAGRQRWPWNPSIHRSDWPEAESVQSDRCKVQNRGWSMASALVCAVPSAKQALRRQSNDGFYRSQEHLEGCWRGSARKLWLRLEGVRWGWANSVGWMMSRSSRAIGINDFR